MQPDSVNIATFILDDDENVLMLIERGIKKLGVENYKLFTNEEEFISTLTEEVHVCVVDHRLTKVTGLDIIKIIREKTSQSYIIVYSGFKDPKIMIEYINSKIDGWVDKDTPGHFEKLYEMILEGIEIAKKRVDFATFIRNERLKHDERPMGSNN